MGYIVHLRIDTDNQARAHALALEIVDEVHHRQPEFDAVSTQLSHEHEQNRRRFILCGGWVGDRRCVRPDRHYGDHSPDWPET